MSRKPDFSRPVIALDCDGVLADMVTPALEIVRGLGGPDLTHDALQVWDIDTLLPEGPIRDEFYNRIGAEGFNRSLKPYPGAEEAVERLRKVGEVVCVTTSLMSSKTWAYERYHWLRNISGFRIRTSFRLPASSGCEQISWPTTNRRRFVRSRRSCEVS